MDLSIEMESSSLSGSISDQPASTRDHDGLLVDERCQSVFAALGSSTTHHGIPPLKAETSKSEPSKKLLLSFQDGSDKKHSPSSDAHDEDRDLFSNSGSGEEYQLLSTPSSSDNEALSEKEKQSSRHSIPEKDHCGQSSSEHEELEAVDLRTRGKSPHPPDRLTGGKKQQGGDKRQNVTVNTSQKKGERTQSKAQYCVYCGKSNVRIARHLQRKHKDEADVAHAFSFPVRSKERKVLLEILRNKGNWQHNFKVLEEGNGETVTWKWPSEKSGSRRGKVGQTSNADRPLKVNDDGDLDHLSTTSSPVERQKKTATKRRNDDNARSESDVDEEEQPQTPERSPVDWSDDEGDGEEQHSITRKSPADRRKKGATTKHDDYDADEESERDVEEDHRQTTRRPPTKRQKTATKHDHDDDWSDDERDGKEQPMMNTAPPVKRRKETSTKEKHAEVSDEEEQSVTSTKSSAKKGKKTASQRGNTDAKIQVKRPWTLREKNAIQRRMLTFIALMKVPRKIDCLRCIWKESPVLYTRTWKDIKYFVYNEIKKIKKRLQF